MARSPAASLAAVALCVLLKAQEGHEQVLKERVGREPGAIGKLCGLKGGPPGSSWKVRR